MYVVRYTVKGESGEWVVSPDNNEEFSNEKFIKAVCLEYGCEPSDVEIISVNEQ
jgi:hypothetical protein